MIDLLNLEPVKTSIDLNSYTTFIYGIPKIGKSTFVYNLYKDKVLFLATENRYKVLSGAMVQKINTWSDYLTVLAQLRNSKLKEKFDVICIDTVENLYNMLEEYILAKYKETEFGLADWGKDWVDLKNSWKNGLSLIEQIGYSPCFISHAIQVTEKIPASGILKEQVNNTMTLVKNKNSEDYYEFTKYVPDLKDKVFSPINKMVDNILFMNITTDEKGAEHRVAYLRGSLQWLAGSTFTDIKSVIPLDAEEYKKAVNEALNLIDKDYTKIEKEENSYDSQQELDFDELMNEAKKIGVDLIKADKKIEMQKIVDEVFGVGNKLTLATKDQVQLLYVAVQRLKELLEA